MSDNHSNNLADSEREDLELTLACVGQITREFDNMTSRLRMDNAEIAMLSAELQRLGGSGSRSASPAGRGDSALAAGFEEIEQSLARQRALGKVLCDAASTFAQELVRWGEDLERREQQQETALLSSPSLPIVTGENGLLPDEFGVPEGLQERQQDDSNASEVSGESFINKTLLALAVKKPDGSVVIVMTKVKTQEQADLLGVPIGTDVPIFVPPDVDPQAMVDQWSRPTEKSPIDFYETWKPGGPNDYKKRFGAIYDAYGNFEYGATGAAYGFTKAEIEGGGEMAAFYQHHAFNNPINRADIGAGHSVISGGGKLLTIPYKWIP